MPVPFLMNLAFDSSIILPCRTYLFEYKSVRFKLVQTHYREYHDHLLTVVRDINDTAAMNRAFAVGAEFVSALAWEQDAAMTVWNSGGAGWRGGSLRFAKPTIFGFRRLPFRGYHIGGNLISIPHVQTNEQRIALALFREARASNSPYLSFLFYWQAMEVLATDPQAFIENVMRNHRRQVPIEDSWLSELPLAGRSIGDYLEDDCRHAVAHIKRRPGRRTLDLDSSDEHRRFTISVRVVEALAEAYITHHLRMSEKLSLVRPRSGGFPRFADKAERERRWYKLAYPYAPLSQDQVRRLVRHPRFPPTRRRSRSPRST